MKIAHRDIKPENILMASEDARVRIGDYTVAMELPNDDYRITGDQGTLAFLAPETFVYETFYPRPLDIWAFGVTLYTYLTLKLPFIGQSEPELKKTIVNDLLDMPENISSELQDLLSQLFEKNPAKRITIE
jgi:serine/threonine protein kinase